MIATQEAQEVLAAKSAHDLFGDVDELSARRRYFSLASAVHPDHGGDPDVIVKLNGLWERAQVEYSLGTYGTPDASIHGLKISSRAHAYTLDRRLAAGEISDVFTGTNENGGKVAMKIVRRPANNAVLVRENQVLREVAGEIEPEFLPYLPNVQDSLGVKENSVIRRANVFDLLDGFHSMRAVKAAYPDFIDPRDGAWMWRRLLTALGAIHSAGFIHGALLPQHAMILGEQRGLVLVGWTAAQKIGEPITLISTPDKGRYPPEVFDKKGARPETDIYMAARLVEELVGPNLPKAFRAHLKAAQIRKAGLRPGDAWELKDSFDDLNERLFGARRFAPFFMPTTAGRKE